MNKKLKVLKALKLFGTLCEGLCVLQEIGNLSKNKRKRSCRKRSCAVRKINRDRKQNGFFNVTFLKIKEMDSGQFFIYTRMSPPLYKLLLNLVSPLLIKTSIRQPISTECRLAVLLHYLSQGTSIQSLAFSFKLGKETVRQIILETSEAVWKVLQPAYVSEPTSQDFQMISDDFWTFWNVPNCIGAIDGKHFSIRCPPKSGNELINNEKVSSIVLMAACDAKYSFTFIDIGTYGSQRDGGIFQASSIGKKLLSKELLSDLPDSKFEIPHYFVSDIAFPLNVNIMRSYSGHLLQPSEENFNKRLSRAHRTIENAFGILVARWRVLLTTLHMLPENAEKIISACISLHNFIMFNKHNQIYCPTSYTDWEDSNGQWHNGLWRDEVNINIPSIAPSPNIHQYGGKTSTIIRNKLRDFLYQN